jgi:hypothetical protein
MSDEFRELLSVAIAGAPLIARKYYQVLFNGTEGDIKKIEWVLAQMHEKFQRGGKSDQITIHQRIMAFYLGEIIARKIGRGEWQENTPLPNVISLCIGEKNWIFPFSWCLKRVEDGIGDAIEFKYKVIIHSLGETDGERNSS